METTPGAGSDKGRKYELSVIALVASTLSKNKSVEDYRIFSDLAKYYPFDDVVAKVVFKGSKQEQIYAIQTKCGNDKFKIKKYFDGYNEIVKQEDEKKMQYYYFAVKDVDYFAQQFMKQGLQWERRSNANPRDIFNEAPCYLLTHSDRKYESLCNNLYLYFDQPNTQKIHEKLEQEWKVNVPPHSYIEKYFTDTKEGLNKMSFEHELLKIRLSNYIVTPTKAISFQHEAVAEWNRLTLERDVTIVRNESNIEGYLFGCISKNISDVIDIIHWNSFIDNEGKLDTEVKQRLRAKSYKAESLKDLLVQLWEEDKIPLLLKTDALLPVLKEFRHLKKRFIIIDSNPTNRYLEIESYKLSVFRHLGDVAADEMMKSISVSLQCRKPTSLFEIIKDDVKLMESITCLDLINLMRPRKVYLRKECLDGDNYMLFIIETANSEQHRDDAQRPNGANIVIYCKLGESYDCQNRFRGNLRFNSYKILRLVDDNRLTLLPRIPDLGTIQSEQECRDLERFFVDEKDESAYVMEKEVIIPIIGVVPIRVRQKYIPRYLREGTKPDKENQGSSKQSTTKYGEKLLPENDILKDSNDKIIVITGEPGMGKTTLLHSLFQCCDSKYYILFNDLARYQVDLRNGKLKTFQDLLRVSRDEYRNLPYKRFLDGLHDYVDRLVLILDSFDEVVATCKDQVVELVRNLEKISLQKIIIASRLTAADLLIGNVKAKTFKIEKFDQESDKQCIADYWNIDISNLRHIPSEFLTTPLYLNMLKYIAENETNLEVVNTWNLYETVVKLKMEDYCRRMEPNIPDDHEALSILLKHGELALKVLFGVNEVTKDFKETKPNRSNFIRLGLIVRYDNENPVFVHQTFVEFFVAKWLIENVDKDDAKYIYELILETRREDILNIHSEKLPLHKAFLYADSNEVLRLCEENKRCLLEMDGLGRSVLHLAVIFGHWYLHRYSILNYLILYMVREGYDIYMRDKIMKWTWINYLEKNDRVEKLFDSKYIFASQAYLNYCATHPKSLNYLLVLKSFIGCYEIAISYSSISMIRTLLSWKYGEDWTFLEFRDMCLHSPTCISREHLDIKLEEEKLDGTHLVCIYGNRKAIKTSIGSRVNFNKMDKFNCTPLHYSVMATQNKQIIGLLIEKYGILNLYAGRYGRTTIFNMSIATDDVNVTKMLLQGLNRRAPDSASLDAIDCDLPGSLLDLAIECRSMNVTETLLEYHSDVGLCLDRPLCTAVKSQQMEIIELLLQHGANPNSNDKNFYTILQLAIETKNENIVRMLLNHNADVNAICMYRTPLTHALEVSTRAIVKLLLRNGADVNYADGYDMTPLMYATRYRGSKDILQLLLNFNADVNVENKDGETPLGMAIKGNKLEIIEILLQNGAHVNHVDSSGWTLLIHAVQREDDYAVQVLLNLNADVNIKGEDGVTPLCMAVKTQNADIVQILLEKGADVNCFDGCGVSPLMTAVETGNTRLATILLENEANVNLKNECGVTGLYAAAFKRDVAMIELLMERGADSNIITMGDDIFHNAKRKGNLEAVAWLLKNRPTTSNNSSDTHAVAIIERVAENWDGINLDDELRTLDPGQYNLVKAYSNSDDKLSSAICSLINAPSNGDVIDIFINNVTNHKIVNLIERIPSTGNYKNVNSLKILWRYYENRFQLLRTVIELNDYDISRCLFQDICSNELDKISDSLLCVAIHRGNIFTSRMLLERGYSANKPDRDGFTPLMIAVCNGEYYFADMLLRSGADVNFEANDSGLTALYIAQLTDDRYMINKLLAYGANRNINTSEDVFKSCVKLAQLYGELHLSEYCTFENRNGVTDIIEEEAREIATQKANDDTDNTTHRKYTMCFEKYCSIT